MTSPARASIAALGGIVFALIEGADAGWTSPGVLAAAAVGLGAIGLFLRTELRRDNPLFDVRTLTRPPVAAGAVTILSVYLVFLGTMFLLPQYLQYVHDRSVLVSSLVLAPIGVGSIVAAPFNARVLRSLGARVTLAGGLVILAASTALLLSLGSTTSLLVVIASTGFLGPPPSRRSR